MSFRTQTLTASALLALAAAGATPALAAGTLAGTEITNTASIDYKVNSVAQTAIATSDKVTVDRVVQVLNEKIAASYSAKPGQQGILTAKVTNLSNTVVDFRFDHFSYNNWNPIPGGPADNFNLANIKYYNDKNSNGTYDSGTDEQITYSDEVAPDASRTVFLVGDVPANALNNWNAVTSFYAYPQMGETPGVMGGGYTNSTGANTAGVDTVVASSINGWTDWITVKTASLTVTRTSKILSNTIEASNFKAIPGAEVEFCVRVTNATGSEPAANVVITESLPAHYVYDATYGILAAGTVTTGTCNTDGTKSGTYTAGTAGAAHTVKGTIGALAAGETKTILYRAKVN